MLPPPIHIVMCKVFNHCYYDHNCVQHQSQQGALIHQAPDESRSIGLLDKRRIRLGSATAICVRGYSEKGYCVAFFFLKPLSLPPLTAVAMARVGSPKAETKPGWRRDNETAVDF
jgi:hypothetical protein